MKIVKFEGIELHIDESNTLSTKEVAQGYGISPSVVRTHKSLHSDELIENVHYIVKRDDKNRVVTRWTLEGVHMLGFFIKSERAKEFRKFTAKLLTEIKKGNVQVSVAPPQNCPADQFDSRIAGYKGMIARQQNEIKMLKSNLQDALNRLQQCQKEFGLIQPIRASLLRHYEKRIKELEQTVASMRHQLQKYAKIKETLAQFC